MFGTLQEKLDSLVAVEEIDNGFVLSGVATVFGVAARIGECAAVEYIAATIAGGVLG